MPSNVNKPNMKQLGEDSPEYKAGSGGYLDRAGSTARETLECKNVQRKVGNRTESVTDRAPSAKGAPGMDGAPKRTNVGQDGGSKGKRDSY